MTTNLVTAEQARELREKATPGPWGTGCGFADWIVSTEGEEGEPIATSPYGSDAELIAKAPDFAETCEALWSVARRLKGGWKSANGDWARYLGYGEGEHEPMTDAERAVIETLNDGDEK